MFERFTDRARAVLVQAQQESIEQGDGFLGTEHILIGLLRVGEGMAHDILTNHGASLDPVRQTVRHRLAEQRGPRPDVSEADALATIGIDLAAVRSRIESSFGPGALPDPGTQPPFTPKAKQSLEHALRWALSLRHRYIGTEHELLGVLDLRDGLACQALAELGVDVTALSRAAAEQAAPEQARVNAAWQALFELRRVTIALSEDDKARAQSVLEQVAAAHANAVRVEQEVVSRVALETAEKLEAAVADLRRQLAGLGIDT